MVIRKVVRPRKIYKCKYCHVTVIGPTDFRPILGKVHAKHCPRHQKG